MKTIFTKHFAKLAVLAAVFAFAMPAKAQVATTYTFAQSAGTFTLVTGTVIASNALGNMDDEVFGPIAMPSFVFDGVAYTSLYVNTNGHVTFGAPSSTTNYLAISGTETYAGAIAAFSEDLDAAASGTRNIRYQQVGTEFVVQWQNVARYSVTGERISFQIRLNNANNQIKVVYGSTITPGNDNFYPEVGLRGPDNTFATNVNNRRVNAATGAWVNSIAGTANTSSCYFNSANAATVPAAGTTFTWTPPAVDISPVSIVSPGNSGCYTNSESVSVQVRNCGSAAINFSTTPLTINASATGTNPVVFPPAIVNSSTLAVNATLIVVVGVNYNMSIAGTYTFNASTSISGDIATANNTMPAVTKTSHTPSIVASNDVAICSGNTTNLSSTATAFAFQSSSSNTTAVAIPDNTPAGVNSTITVSGAPVAASSISVRIDNLVHTFDGDLIFKLTAPDGSFIILSNLNGGAGANFVNTLFTASAVTPIASGTAPFTGSFLPDNPFTGLTGLANGVWTLNVSDNASADIGTLQGWTLFYNVANSIASYAWTPAGSLSSATISNPVASPTVTTTYTVVVTDASGCTNNDNVIVTVNPLPTVTANSTAPAVCAGGSVTLTGGGATSYTWTGSVTNGVPFVPVATNTYTVTGTDGNGCMNTASTTVTVNPTPTVTATAGTPTICSGNSTTLNGNGATTYSWMPGNLSGATVTVSPTATTTYTVTGTSAGCSSTGVVTVTVNPTPTVTATAGTPTICSGNSTTLNGNGATTYSWMPGNLSGTSVTVSPAATTTYTVTGTSTGCSSTGLVTVTVNPTPTVTATAGTPTICSGNSTTLNGNGATTYSWMPGNLSGTSVTVSPTATTTYTVTGTSTGCSSTGLVTVTVNPTPTVTATAGTPTICSGNSTTLNGNGATTYSWMPGNLTGTTVTVSPASTTTYTVTGTSTGCSSTGLVTVTVNPTPTVTATASPATICTGNSSTLTGNGATTYSWMPGSLTGTNVNVTPSATTTYTVTGTSAGCTGTGLVTVNVNATPTVTATASPSTICAGNATTLTGNGGSTYTWMPGNLSGTTVSVTPATTTTYTVTGTSGPGCTGTGMVTVTVNPTPTVAATASPAAICTGSSATLTGSGAAFYLWMPGNIVGSPTTVTPTATTTYTLTGSSLQGCLGSATTTVTVNPLPVVTANSTASTVCSGSPVTLSGGGATSYTWTSSVTNAVPFNPTVTNTYTVTGTDANGCTNTASTTVTVNPLPTVTANTTATAVCTGGSVTLTGGGATSYTWSGSVTNGVPFVPVATTTYTVTGTNGNGCTNTASITITVNPLPTVTANTTATAVCAGNSVTLTGGGATSYTWTGNVTDNVAFTPVATNSYTVTGTNGNGCTNTASLTVTVNALPNVTANSTATAVCNGGSVTLTGGGATSYTWTGSVTNNVAFTPVTTNSYTVTGTDGNGCVNTASITVAVNALPTVTANSTATVICEGTSVTLTGGGATSYTWTGSVNDNVAFTPVVTNTYTVTGTDGNGCTNTASATVTVNALPVVAANTTATAVCNGSAVTLTGSGASSYTWTGNVIDGAPFVPATTDTYTVTGTDGNGCVNTATTTVTVNANPVVNLGPDQAVCSGTITLDAGNPGDTYAWSDASNLQTFTTTTTGVYWVDVTNASGCVTRDSVSVSINNNPVVTLGADITQCGGTVTLDAGNPGAVYTWSDASTAQTLTVSVSGTYYVTDTLAGGCFASDTIVVTINPVPSVNLGADITQCGGTATLDAGNAGSTYLWSDAVTTTQVITIFNSGVYYVDVMNASGCSMSDTVNVTINTAPNVTATAASGTACIDDEFVALTGLPAGGTWTGPGVNGSSFTPSVAGLGTQSLTYNYVDTNGCSGAASVTITVNACVGVSETTLANGMSIYPNPNNGMFNLSISNPSVNEMKMEVLDVQGQLLYTEMLTGITQGYNKQLDLSMYANGIYLLKISSGNEVQFVKVSVQR